MAFATAARVVVIVIVGNGTWVGVLFLHAVLIGSSVYGLLNRIGSAKSIVIR